MTGQQIGYIRVSTIDQNTARQLVDVELDHIYEEKVSAKDVKRPQLQECLQHLRKGDTLHIHSIDRLARNLLDLQKIIDLLMDKGVNIHFHKEGLQFTGENNPFQVLQLQIIGAVAEFERNIIKERQREGIALAQKAGKQIGRKSKITNEQKKEIRVRLSQGATKKAVAQEFGISRQTLYNVLG